MSGYSTPKRMSIERNGGSEVKWSHAGFNVPGTLVRTAPRYCGGPVSSIEGMLRFALVTARRVEECMRTTTILTLTSWPVPVPKPRVQATATLGSQAFPFEGEDEQLFLGLVGHIIRRPPVDKKDGEGGRRACYDNRHYWIDTVRFTKYTLLDRDCEGQAVGS